MFFIYLKFVMHFLSKKTIEKKSNKKKEKG